MNADADTCLRRLMSENASLKEQLNKATWQAQQAQKALRAASRSDLLSRIQQLEMELDSERQHSHRLSSWGSIAAEAAAAMASVQLPSPPVRPKGSEQQQQRAAHLRTTSGRVAPLASTTYPPKTGNMVDRARAIKEDLKARAKAAATEAAAEKPSDPIYSLIANVNAMNKEVRSAFRAAKSELNEDDPEALTKRDKAGVPTATARVSALAAGGGAADWQVGGRGTVGLAGTSPHVPGAAVAAARVRRESGLSSAHQHRHDASESLTAIKVALDAGLGPAGLAKRLAGGQQDAEASTKGGTGLGRRPRTAAPPDSERERILSIPAKKLETRFS